MRDAFYQLFLDGMRDMYSGEKQIIDALPKMVHAASNKDLKETFETHLAETRNQKKRLDQAFKILKEDPDGETCEAMEGLLTEADEIIHRKDPSEVEDAALIMAAQKVEHYEIATYGTLRTFAHHLGYEEIEKLLQKSLDEEGSANKKLTTLAEGSFIWSGINAKATRGNR